VRGMRRKDIWGTTQQRHDQAMRLMEVAQDTSMDPFVTANALCMLDVYMYKHPHRTKAPCACMAALYIARAQFCCTGGSLTRGHVGATINTYDGFVDVVKAVADSCRWRPPLGIVYRDMSWSEVMCIATHPASTYVQLAQDALKSLKARRHSEFI